MSILKSILHRWSATTQSYDTLHPETEHAQVTDFGQGVIAHLVATTLASTVTAVSTSSVFGKMVGKLLEASGLQYNFQNSNAWYICMGSLFGGLIIQGGTGQNLTPSNSSASIDYPLSGKIRSHPFAIATYIGVVVSTTLPSSTGFTVNAYFARTTDQTNIRWFAFVW